MAMDDNKRSPMLDAQLLAEWAASAAQPYVWPSKPVPPATRTCVSIPAVDSNGWMDVRIPAPGDIGGDNVSITVDIAGHGPVRFAVTKDDLMKVLSELAMEKLAK